MSVETLTTIFSGVALLLAIAGGFGWLIRLNNDTRKELRTELREEIGGLRGEFREEIGGLRTELREEIGGLRGEIAGLRDELSGVKVAVARLEGRMDGKAQATLLVPR